MDDEYAPALDMAETPADVAETPAVVESLTTSDGPPPPDVAPRGQRVVSDKVRGMFKAFAEAARKGEVTLEADDLVPVEHEPAAAVASPAVAAATVAPVVAAPPVAPATAVQSPPAAATPRQMPPSEVGKFADEQRKLQLEEREAQLVAREAQLVAREGKLPSRDKLVESPVPTIAEWIRETYGITNDEELKDAITDLMTEMSVTYHGVQLPDDVKTRVDSRKALRSVRAYKTGIDREKAELAERQVAQQKSEEDAREEREKQEYSARAVGQLTDLLGKASASYPFLAQQEGSAEVVWEILKDAHAKGVKTDWSSAAKHADDYFKQQFEVEAQRVDRLRNLLAPAAPAAPAKPATQPGGAPGPAPKTPAQAVQPQTPSTPVAVDPADDIIGEDRRDRRARSLRGLAAKHGLGATPR